ncbi:MAG TPA: hypothetical protein VGC15_20440 [Acetobacteraceae bacterium]
MTLSAVLLLLAYPGAWSVLTLAPPTICGVGGAVCLIRTADVLIVDSRADTFSVTALHGPEGTVAWNEAVLRVADQWTLQRDRRDRGEGAP